MARRRLAAIVDAVIRGLAHADLACLQGTADAVDRVEFGTSFHDYCARGLRELELYLGGTQLGPA